MFSFQLKAQHMLHLGLLLLSASPYAEALAVSRPRTESLGRERVNINSDWRFWRSEENPDGIIYDQRKDLEHLPDAEILKDWVLPSANDFIRDTSKHYKRPEGKPSTAVPYVQGNFDDEKWDVVNLPHDWAISGPFYTDADGEAIVGGGMGRLPVHGVGWYRREIEKTTEDKDKQIYLDIDGAMSFAMVWLNGELIGGWPYPYNSFRLDLTPHLKDGGDNILAIRLDNPVKSARWYPGGGIYRNVWLTKVEKTHVGQWGTFIKSRDVSSESATLDLTVEVENSEEDTVSVDVVTEVFVLDSASDTAGEKVASFPKESVQAKSGEKTSVTGSITISNPQLWGPPPTQTPHLYVAITKLYSSNGDEVDRYESNFGIRSVEFTANDGLLVNGERIQIHGVNQHHDLGAIGAAFNTRAAERQLELLLELGSNAIRMSHNPPAPELLHLTDKMGFLVIDEVFDSWNLNKTDNDFHIIFPDWHEADLRSFMRRDRNHASVIAWSYGNEVLEQRYGGTEGAELSRTLRALLEDEDSSRPSTASLNFAQPGNDGDEFTHTMDIIGLNYQGSGIRDLPNYSHLSGIHTSPAFPLFRETFPDKFLFTSESASALSTRGTYFFPVADDSGAPVNETSGGNKALAQVSAYEVYSADFGSSADRAFDQHDRHPYVAGEFVWTGWDYLGEPTPYYSARSSYTGIIDLAGFKKDRFYLYQARWRPDLPMAHILPHWNWPERKGEETPVHVFTSGDEAELFLNGESLGRKKKEEYKYRLRWDDVKYEPGELHVITYKEGERWAEATVRTTGEARGIRLTADRSKIASDGLDLSFITADIIDESGGVVPVASNDIHFSVCGGGGKLVATDNGDPADLNVFQSTTRKAFSGKALAIVSAQGGQSGKITVVAKSEGLQGAKLVLEAS
ncbi:unnamed protein product [Clonostachys rosea f. rosea IK726]|uniref:Beta-galactosidase n=2 Tax=Bionectria ochroleuca TaxID=29856 RepID=A0A0B7JV82_BIOOC|nr:unnamed protein product [Clonostachys rosea f. rosea IK726]